MSLVNGDKLTLRKDLPMIFQFFNRVGLLRGVNHLANLDDGIVVRGGDETDLIVGRKHGGLHSSMSSLLFMVRSPNGPWQESDPSGRTDKIDTSSCTNRNRQS